MATATVALLVSVISASITLGGLVWQFTLYRLSGARLRVELIFVYLDEDRSKIQKGDVEGTSTNLPMWASLALRLRKSG